MSMFSTRLFVCQLFNRFFQSSVSKLILQLQKYSAILIYGNASSLLHKDQTGDNFADYVDSGGGVVVTGALSGQCNFLTF